MERMKTLPCIPTHKSRLLGYVAGKSSFPASLASLEHPVLCVSCVHGYMCIKANGQPTGRILAHKNITPRHISFLAYQQGFRASDGAELLKLVIWRLYTLFASRFCHAPIK